jgi:hypothetical protein
MFTRLKRWYLWRFRKTVQAPGGTRWRQRLGAWEHPFTCSCGEELCFDALKDYVIRRQEHAAECLAGSLPACFCPVTDARYVKVCPHCGAGHWIDASPPKLKG